MAIYAVGIAIFMVLENESPQLSPFVIARKQKKRQVWEMEIR